MTEKPQDAPESNEKKDVVFLDLFDPRQHRSDQELVEDGIAGLTGLEDASVDVLEFLG